MSQPPWEHRGPPPWMRNSRHRRRFTAFRLVFPIVVLLVLFLAIQGAVFIFSSGTQRNAFSHPGFWIFLLFVLPVWAAISGSIAYRRLGRPLSEMMAATDAVAEGDLSVRVREDLPGDFGRMARGFNRMTAELERAEQQRRNLTADVAHELRTPLHIIQGNLEGILDGVYQPTSEHLTATLDETRFLARLVNDLQTLSLAEAGQLPLHKERVSAADLLEDAATGFSAPAAAAGVALTVDVGEGDPALEVQVDPDRMGQVLNNLIANALRYTPSGGRITLRAVSRPDGVRLTVRDTGAGIPPEDLPYVFDRFWKGDRSRARSSGSSGLGLSIARQLVHANGGQINVESQLGVGTTFVIELPPARDAEHRE